MIKPSVIAIGLMLVGCRVAPEHPEIRAVLNTQVEDWNRADIEAFMDPYWHSDDLTFTSRHKEIDPATGKQQEVTERTSGWAATLERYQRRYPTPQAMGRLSFSDLKIARLGDDDAEVAGRYHLERKGGPAAGRFFLVMRRIDGHWVIVRDQTVSD